MFGKPRAIYILLFLWLALSSIFLMWGGYSLWAVIEVPEWGLSEPLTSILHFGYISSTILWFVFSPIFVIFFFGTYRAESWVWNIGLVFSTIFLVIFSIMLTAFMINALLYRTDFVVLGLVTVVLAFLADLGIVFHLTRPSTKEYLGVK